jgi:hypothetical protein
MNHRESPQVPKGMRRAVHSLALLLSAATSGTMLAHVRQCPAHSQNRERCASVPGGYLPVLGAPPLRFAEVLPPHGPASQTAVATPSKPAPNAHATVPANAGAALATQSLAHPVSPEETKDESHAAEKTEPLAILSDESTPTVRPEDFLPFFLPPTSTPVAPAPREAPAPATLEPSSATYTQTPR